MIGWPNPMSGEPPLKMTMPRTFRSNFHSIGEERHKVYWVVAWRVPLSANCDATPWRGSRG